MITAIYTVACLGLTAFFLVDILADYRLSAALFRYIKKKLDEEK